MSQESEKALVEKRAKNAALARDFNLAERLYKGLLNAEPSNTKFLLSLGNMYVQNGNDDSALPYFEKVLEVEPANFNALNSMGAIYRRMKKYDESIGLLQKALDTGENDLQAHYNIGFTYKDMGKYDEAIECFETVTQENPHDVLAFNHLASIYALRENHDRAISIYNRGLQIDPNHPILQYNLAHSYEAVKRYEDAVSAYETALRSKPGWREATYDLMKLLTQRNKTKAAANLINKTISLYPYDVTLKHQLGNILMSQFDFDEAIKVLEDARKIDSENIGAMSALADAYEKAERAIDAIPIMDKIEKDNPGDKQIQKQFAHILLSAHELEKAGIKINKLYSDDKNDVQVLDLYGQYYICKKDEDSARWYFEKINSLDSKYDKYINEAAERYRQSGLIDKAEEYAKDYLEKHSDDSEAYVLLSRIQEAQGKHESALELLQRSLEYNPDNALAKKSASRIASTINEKSETEENDNANAVVEDSDENLSAQLPEESVPPETTNQVDESFDFDSMNEETNEDLNDEDIIDIDAVFDSEDVPAEDDNDFTNLVSTGVPFDSSPENMDEGTHTDNLFNDEDIQAIPTIEPKAKVLTSVPMQDEVVHSDTEKPRAPEPPRTSPPIQIPKASYQPTEAYDNRTADEVIYRAGTAAVPIQIPQVSYHPPVSYDNRALDEAIYRASASADQALAAADRAGRAAENAAQAANSAATDVLESAVEAAKRAVEEATEYTAEMTRLAAAEAVAAAKRVAAEAAESAEEATKLAAADAIEKMQALIDSSNLHSKSEELENESTLLSPATRLLPGIIAMLEQKKNLEHYREMLSLFKSIKGLANNLPPEQFHAFMSSKIRLQLEYVISKLSGKPGLIAIVNALNEAVAETGSKLETQKSEAATDDIDVKIGVGDAEAVIAELGMLAMSLEDKDLAQALTETADDVLQKL